MESRRGMLTTMIRLLTCLIAGCFAVSPIVFAGGGPQNVLVVVNQTSSNSIALGRYYLTQRGLHERQLLRIATTNERNISVAAFSNEIRGPIFTYLAESGLEDQIDYIVFSRDIPYRVFSGDYTNSRHAGLTSTMYYGFFASSNAFISGCNLATGSANAYAAREEPFRRPDPPVNTRYLLSAMITASNQADALAVIDRAVASDFTRPAATVFFEHGEDQRRNGRWPQYEETAFALRFITNGPTFALVDGLGDTTPRTNAMGLMTGLQAYPRFGTTSLRPGALAEHLTSFAGFLFNSTEGEGWREPYQMKITSWIAAGAGGSYGTVVEPCAYTNKFPDARLHLYYGRGFSLGESFYQALANPYQGILLGDPLGQPYAEPPLAGLAGVTNNEQVSGIVNLTVTGRITGVTGTVDRIDLYLNELFAATIHRQPLTPSNMVTATINGTSRSYTVKTTDTLADVASGLAAAINANPPVIPVTAAAAGDRVQLRQKEMGPSGSTITAMVSVAQGTATNLGLIAWTPQSTLLDSTFHAFATSRLAGAVTSGEVFRAVFTRLDGTIVTSEVTAATGWTARTVMTTLRDAINSDTNLTTPEGIRAGRYALDPYSSAAAELVFHARAAGPTGLHASVALITTSTGAVFTGGGAFNDNTNVLTARGMIFLAAGRDEIATTYAWDTTARPDGPHRLRIVVHRGDGPGTQGHLQREVIIKNHNLTVGFTNLLHAPLLSFYEPLVPYFTADTGGTVTSVALWAEGKIHATTNAASGIFHLDPDTFGLGPLTLQVQAFNDAGQSTLSEAVMLTISRDATTTGGVPHAWLHDQGITNDFESAANTDLDGDGALTWQEYVMNTDPTDSNAVLKIAQQTIDVTDLAISWPTSTGRLYSLQVQTSLFQSIWLYDTGVQHVVGTGGWLTYTTTPPPGTTMLYHRIEVERP